MLVLVAVLFFGAAEFCSGLNTSLSCIEGEREALLKFKLCFNDLSDMLSSWKGNDCCEWRVVGCDKNSRHVVSLQLRGSISDRSQLHLIDGVEEVVSVLLKLRCLEYLDLSGNNLNSSVIPPFFGLLKQLSYLNLSSVNFRGRIPSELGNLTRLRVLDLSDKFYRRLKVDDVQWISHLFSLQQLDMSGVNLSHASSNLFQLSKLMSLDLSSNQLSGSIPYSIAKLSELKLLDLSNNQLSGSIPDSIGQLSKLKGILFSSNQLSGGIPYSLRQLSKLRTIYLSSNQLCGSIPDSIKQLAKLKSIDLSNNQLGIGFPKWLLLQNTTTMVDLSNASISGPLLENIDHMMPMLRELYLKNNLMNGSIPQSLCNSKFLEALDLSNNMFSGSIPNCWRKNQSFNFIDLSSNNLLDNNLTGRIPLCFGKFPKMVNATQLMKRITDDYWSWAHLKEVVKGRYLEYTRKTLGLESSIDLSSNNLIGSIPKELIFLKDLHILNLSWNHLSGKIPEKIGQMENLESLDFSQNGLSGTIQNSMSSLTKLSHLNLSYNNLLRPIPTGYQLQTLEDPTIYVGNPQLCGAPLLKKCSNDVLPPPIDNFKDNNEGALTRMWFYIVVMLGFVIGFWGVMGTLIFVKTWRYAYFRWVDDVQHWILMVITLKVARVKKMFNGNPDDQ
ncbi:hypothetical protein SLEP1_g50952 [Rubroshorea leprosula]|uniref:Leucine-rich repeat-containing N-terminal plant-type domain-containing protein n=1 Tax=Rubroshorea leprosula TaxID=152421 RepID=A0AAV5M473_9ROSI|nr:hypothetical protein SLEP1_g50952 [Rubroshorea leprosula]